MRPSDIVSVERVLDCLGPGERCTRAEIMRRLDAGMATTQYMLNACVACGVLSYCRVERHLVWWRSTPVAGPSSVEPIEVLQGYDAALQRFAQLCMAARHPPPPGQVVRFGVGEP